MRTLRNLMSDLTGTLGQATSSGATGADTLKARRMANRSSVANLEALWNTHLQELWKRVEGSQKYLPAIPGRHIVYESRRWVELNAATWKPRRRVVLILLNDHFLVATEKKRAEGSSGPREKQGPSQYVALRCWPLQEIQIADLPERALPGSGDKKISANSINVRVGTESVTFATGSQEAAEKVQLLTTFRRTQEDLRRKLEEESKNRDLRQDATNFLAARDAGVLQSPDLMESLNETSVPRSDMLIDVDGKPQSIRWIEGQIDELDIDIALQRFEEAIAQSIITLKLNERAARLESVITRYLKDSPAWMTATKRHIDWLVRLGFEDRAREAYLEARSETIKKRVR